MKQSQKVLENQAFPGFDSVLPWQTNRILYNSFTSLELCAVLIPQRESAKNRAVKFPDFFWRFPAQKRLQAAAADQINSLDFRSRSCQKERILPDKKEG